MNVYSAAGSSAGAALARLARLARMEYLEGTWETALPLLEDALAPMQGQLGPAHSQARRRKENGLD